MRPVIVCVGFRTLFEGAHVPGASFHGPAIEAKGLDDLKKFAQALPRSTDLVVYCGCCPLAHCPNIRPAFEALRAMGFTHLKVLLLPHDFAHDWVQAGYPVAKGARSGDVAGHPANGIVGSIPADDGTRPARIRVAGDVQRHNLIHMVYPIYPQNYGNGRLPSGTVLLHAVIAKDGTVKELKYVSGPQWLAKSAIDAVRQWRYRPTLLNGKPVEVDTTISVVYKLGG